MSAEDDLAMLIRPDWFLDASCPGKDPDYWFAGDFWHSATDKKYWEEVDRKLTIGKKICSNCQVQNECLTKGLFEQYGTWGGLDTEERADLIELLNLKETNRMAGKS